MGDGVEETWVVERAAGDDLIVCPGQRKTGTGPGVIDFVLPCAEAEEFGELGIDARAFSDAVNLFLHPRPVIEGEFAQALLPGADFVSLRGFGIDDEITEEHGDVGMDLITKSRALLEPQFAWVSFYNQNWGDRGLHLRESWQAGNGTVRQDNFFTTDYTDEYRIPIPAPLLLSGYYLRDLWLIPILEKPITLRAFLAAAAAWRRPRVGSQPQSDALGRA